MEFRVNALVSCLRCTCMSWLYSGANHYGMAAYYSMQALRYGFIVCLQFVLEPLSLFIFIKLPLAHHYLGHLDGERVTDGGADTGQRGARPYGCKAFVILTHVLIRTILMPSSYKGCAWHEPNFSSGVRGERRFLRARHGDHNCAIQQGMQSEALRPNTLTAYSFLDLWQVID